MPFINTEKMLTTVISFMFCLYWGSVKPEVMDIWTKFICFYFFIFLNNTNWWCISIRWTDRCWNLLRCKNEFTFPKGTVMFYPWGFKCEFQSTAGPPHTLHMHRRLSSQQCWVFEVNHFIVEKDNLKKAVLHSPFSKSSHSCCTFLWEQMARLFISFLKFFPKYQQSWFILIFFFILGGA